ENYIALPDAGTLSGAARFHLRDDRAVHLLQPETGRHVRRHRLHEHAETRARDLAVGAELVHHMTRHVRRNREADPDVAVRWRHDLRVDADELALRVHERATG